MENIEREEFPKDMPDKVTLPYFKFLSEMKDLSGFLAFVFMLSVSADEMTKTMARHIDRHKDVPGLFAGQMDEDSIQRISSDGAGAGMILYSYLQLVSEMALCRAVDAYSRYIEEILRLMYHSPALKQNYFVNSNKKIDLKTVFEFSDMEELLKSIIEKRVRELSYESLRDLSDYISKEHGFELFENAEAEKMRAIRIMATRNLIVHNQGIVNDIFLSQVPDSSAKIGEKVQLGIRSVGNDTVFLHKSVLSIDKRASDKFQLPTMKKALP